MVGGKSRHTLGHLAAFAGAYGEWLAGELIACGLNPRIGSWPAHVAVPLLTTMLCRAAGPGTVHKVLRALREPFWLDEDSWGTGPTAEAGQDAMMVLASGKVPEGVPKRK